MRKRDIKRDISHGITSHRTLTNYVVVAEKFSHYYDQLYVVLMSSANAVNIPPPNDFLVGSTEDLQLNQSQSSRPEELGSLESRYGSLGIPSPLRPALRGRSVSTTSRLMPSTPKQEQQWTVFGQLMENEGPLWTSASGGSRRNYFQSPSTTSVNDSFSALPSSPAIASSSPIVEESSLGDVFMNVSSREDNEYDSEDTDSTFSLPFAGDHERKSWFQRLPTIPIVYQNILKCAIAYLIASLFTFNPYLSSFISDLTTYGDRERRPSPSGHMVATMQVDFAVYFNPAKSMGAMVEADLFCLMGLVFSALLCLSSMTLFWWLERKPGWEWLADFLVIALIGVGMSAVAWMKVWMASPSFNTACSMTAIIIFVVLVKEGGLQTLLQVSFIVLCGSLTSNAVCYAIWPQSATEALQGNMTKTLDSFSTLLGLLTNAFLLEEGLQQPSHERLMKAVSNHQSSFTSLKKSLKEAQSEWVNGSATRTSAYEDAVDSMNRLAQHLNGLRGGTRLQYDLAKAGVIGKIKQSNGKQKARMEDDESVMLEAAAEMFGELVEDVGPPLKALSTTCTSTLKRMRESFVLSQRPSRRKILHQNEFLELVDGIERALAQFETTSNHAVLRLYRRSAASDLPPDLRESVYSEDTQVLSGSENEHVFLVYFFIFTLQEFAGELVSLVDAMKRIYSLEQAQVNRAKWWERLHCCFRSGAPRRKRHANGNVTPPSGTSTPRPLRKPTRSLQGNGLRKKFSQYISPAQRRTHPMFPKVKPHAPNTIQTPAWERLSWLGRIKQRVWAIGTRLTENDTKYAIKAGMATAILASPAFFDATRHIFVDFWGDWALISFFIVISPTIGATNYLSLHRILGTFFGAVVAAAVYSQFPDDAVLLTVFGFFFSIPCFYYIVAKPQYVSAARFVLLTYNLTCLYCYNLRQREVSPWDVAVNRALSVTIGVVAAAFVSRFWWPAEARKELTKALGEFCLNIGWLYTRLVAANSFAPIIEDDDEVVDTEMTALSPAHDRLSHSIKDFMAMELHLQIKLIELQGLLAQTQNEPRLKGPFPVQLYRGILTSLQTILDRLHSMRCVTTREEWYTSVRQDFIVPVNKERREMVGNIILGFSTLASAFRLKAPLPPYLPPAEAARQRLVAAIRKLDVVRNREVKGSRQLLFFAYALTMKGVTVELENLGRTLQGAFGVIGQSPEEFEALFLDPHSEDRERVDHTV
ncbi:ArAE-2 domain-containing protein [Mycena indigotica]|uniref:ArAE-2 domain-containing protein n=1 Tax=Mycena indigotica TaxID=2126181 RepID=A0A8H6TBY8_9AGAR|nr:ArAE-2 domain-containing protein [Mycena indigotica]KAF7315965.1 ArAE-2 domain-containing protein [Mycena indigotica]